jgi:site-specific recombinase XerD
VPRLLGVVSAALMVEHAHRRYVAERHDVTRETVRSFRETFRLFAGEIGADRPLSSVSRKDLDTWMRGMGRRRLATATIRLRVGTVRGFFKWAVLEGLIKTDPTLAIRLPKLPRELPRGLKDSQVGRLLAACRDDRERLIVLLMRREGLRAIEVANLQLADIDEEDHSMIVRGKGGHQRYLPIVGEVWSLMQTHLAVRGGSAGHLIQSYQQSYANPDDGLSAKYVARIVGDVFRRAGLRDRGQSGHALRHTFAHRLLDAGGNLRDAQVALGHVSIATTQRYLGFTAVRELRGLMEGSGGAPSHLRRAAGE